MDKFVFPESLGRVNKTINVPRKLVLEVEELLSGRKTSFSDFTVAAIEFTLKHVDK